MGWAAKKSGSSVVYGGLTTAKPHSHPLSKRIERTGRYVAPTWNLRPMRCARPAQEFPGGDVELPAEPFIGDQRLDLFYRMRIPASLRPKEPDHELH
jgi:hypothetical protein